jgi:serine/threonine protein kinase/formylglycine-generating enzyme required for sulfatase activity
MDAVSTAHPTRQVLTSFGLGKLDDRLAEAVQQHLDSCLDCQRQIAELPADSFLGRVREAQHNGTNSGGAWSKSSVGTSGSESSQVHTLPSGLADHQDYEMIRELGRGGMGVVYLVENKLMGRKEVLKVVGSHLLNRPGVQDRFLREIRSAAKLHHTNIVTAYTALRFGESLALSMEYVNGFDLSELVKAKGPLPVRQACNFIQQAAQGLQHALAHGMVHRDIKPSNLMCTSEGNRAVVKVLDFGLAKVTSEGQRDSNLTREGQMLGTPDFIAPEQIRNAQSADIRADIYSLGCTLYYVLTGQPPFSGEHLWDLYQAHFSMDAPGLNLLRPEVPVELAAVVAKAMAKEPGRRFQTPADVVQALTPFLKRASTALAGDKREESQTEHVDTAHAMSSLAAAPAQSHRNLSPATTPAREQVSPPPEARSIWEDLIDLGEGDCGVINIRNRSKAQPDENASRQVRMISPLPITPRRLAAHGSWAIAGLLAMGLVFALAVAIRGGKPNSAILLEDAPTNGANDINQERIAIAPHLNRPSKVEAHPGNRDVEVHRGDEVRVGQGATLESGKSSAVRNQLKSPIGPEPSKNPVLAERQVHGNGTAKTDMPIEPSPKTPEDATKLKVADTTPAPKPAVRGDQVIAPKPLEPRESIKNSVGMTLNLIPAGEFMMGSPDPNAPENERPEHRVRISTPFFLGATEVTQAQYAAVMRHNPSFFSPQGEGKDKIVGQPYGQYPVEQVSWLDAAQYCSALSFREHLLPYYQVNGADVQIPNQKGLGYRLPTEAEWEYACRGGKSGKYSPGPDSLAEYGWFAANSEGSTHPVGKKRPNEFGLYDMAGNVWEWCFDGYGSAYYAESPAVDPQGPLGMSTRVRRGGTGWRSPMRSTWWSTRGGVVPNARGLVNGFRVARLQAAQRGSAKP